MKKRTRADHLLQCVAAWNGLSLTAIRGDRQDRRACRARQTFWAEMAFDDPSVSLATLGRMTGGRHQSTVLRGIKAHCRREGLAMPGHLRGQITGRDVGGRTVSFWTPRRLARVRALADAGKTGAEAAAVLGTTPDALRSAATRNGIRFTYRKPRRAA